MRCKNCSYINIARSIGHLDKIAILFVQVNFHTSKSFCDRRPLNKSRIKLIEYKALVCGQPIQAHICMDQPANLHFISTSVLSSHFIHEERSNEIPTGTSRLIHLHNGDGRFNPVSIPIPTCHARVGFLGKYKSSYKLTKFIHERLCGVIRDFVSTGRYCNWD